jgi:hypothetical protein
MSSISLLLSWELQERTTKGKINVSILFMLSVLMAANVLPLAAVGDFGALHSQPSTNVSRSTALDVTTSAPIAANGC